MKQNPTESEKKIDKSTALGEDLCISLSVVSETIRLTIGKEAGNLKRLSELLDLTDISRHSTSNREYILLQRTRGSL